MEISFFFSKFSQVFLYQETIKDSRKGILLKGNVIGFLSFETSARLYPLAHFVNLVQDEWEN